MGNRIIKESIRTSEKLAAVSDFAYRVWTSLITMADDTGCGDGRAAIIKGFAFPLRQEATIEGIRAAMEELEAAGCIRRYTVEGREYFCFPNWERHQRIRNVKPKFPGPDQADGVMHSATLRPEEVRREEKPAVPAEPEEAAREVPAAMQAPAREGMGDMTAHYDRVLERMGPEKCLELVRTVEAQGLQLSSHLQRWRDRYMDTG